MTPSIERVPYKRPYNSPLECGLRALFILSASPCALDLQRLISYDYFLVHSGDVPSGPMSLHPAVPHRSGEFLVRREILQAGLHRMLSKELIEVEFSNKGFFYKSTPLTQAFIKLLKTPYCKHLQDRARWVSQHFSGTTDDQLNDFMAKRIGEWGAEFENLTAMDSLEL
ncbi:hypothetical protein CEY04_22885 [Achromobacter sp. HZ28]|nr:hypothetical protein CEY05_24050 [Achromobacter sp. HZ34]OWT74262.1 hypothetical protein CEY04_22885 [Achromobacter sp. HZ28]